MKRSLSYAAMAMAVLAACGSACRDTASSPSADASTYHLVCGNCNHVWVIKHDEARTYPADPNGAGFKCEKCGKFAAKVGTECKKCKNWYIAAARGMSCPHCQKAGATPG